MQKPKLHSCDRTDDNVERIAELFSGCVTESRDEHGKTRKVVDFDQLRQELSGAVVEGPRERYHLDWPGKREALLAANSPTAKTLRPCREESVEFDATRNLFIEGDNLEALKLIQEAYLNGVKMIYIDPPYNTGNDFIYDDDFAEDRDAYLARSLQVDLAGNRLVANTEASGRFHSDWLTMMYSRLRLARNLLSEDGVIFISIDDHEAANLVKLCDEIFGCDNFIAAISVQVNPRGRHLDKYIAKTHEQILVYSRSSNSRRAICGLDKSGKMVDEYDRSDARGKYRLLGLRNRNQAFNPRTRPNLYFPLYVNPLDQTVSVERSGPHTDEVLPVTTDGIQTCWTWGKDKVAKESTLLTAEKTGAEWRIHRKDYLVSADGAAATTLPKSLWVDKEFSNDYGRKVIKNLFGEAVMDFPKSVQLIKHLVKLGASEGDLVLDFFGGSATTAHAVMELNAEDGGGRRFVIFQLPELCAPESAAFRAGFRTIAEVAKERIRRAGKLMREQSLGETSGLDTGFRVLKVDTSNMKDVYYRPDAVAQADLLGHADNIREGRTPEDLVFQVLLDRGLDLSSPIRQEVIDGKKVWFVAGDALAACFDPGISEVMVKEVARRRPRHVVFRDSGYASDSVKINVEQILKSLSPATEVKSI